MTSQRQSEWNMSTSELIQSAVPLLAQPDDSTSNSFKSSIVKKPVRSEADQDREAFFRALQSFHESRNTPITRLPKVNGKEVDLHLLYNEVVGRGGWLKVNIRNEWDELAKSMGFPQRCVNAAVAIKSIYTRFLDKYERLHFLGEDPDKNDDLDDDGRPKKWSSKSYHSIPMTYNYKQHELTEEQRTTNRMSMTMYVPSEYDRLLLSLLSPLPNEQDFAINVCTLMSNESKHTLKIDHCPKLVDALLAHAGVFCHYSMRELFQNLYTNVRRHSLQQFWNDLLYEKPHILELSLDDYVQAESEMYTDDLRGSFPDNVDPSEECIGKFLNLGPGLGTQEYVGQRVLQIASIMRNLSFYDENVTVLAKNRTFVRFLVMGSNIRWANLHHMVLDVFGNIAMELDLEDPTLDDLTRCMMSTVCEGIEGPDRGVIISCLEVLYKVCQQDTNEEHIHKCLSQKLYNTLCLYLSLNDIMLLLYTLESIYALTSLGHRACNSLVQVRGVINSLMSLVTVEAQSYGPDGCILMRVVETVPGNMLPMVAQNIANIANLQNAINTQQTPQQPPESAPITSGTSATPAPRANPETSPSQGSKSPNPTPQDNEQFALSWLSATFEPTSSADSRVEQQELYRMYLSATQKSGRRGIVSHTQFPRMVRTIFGSNVGPTVVKKGESTESNKVYYVCLRIRGNPLPIQAKPSTTPKTPKDLKQKLDMTSVKKTKKKLKLQEQSAQEQPQKTISTTTVTSVTTSQPSSPTASNPQQSVIRVEESPQQQSVEMLTTIIPPPPIQQVANPVQLTQEVPVPVIASKLPSQTQVSKIPNPNQPQIIGNILLSPATNVVQQTPTPLKITTIAEQPQVAQQQVSTSNFAQCQPHHQVQQQQQQQITQFVTSSPSNPTNGGNSGAQPSSSLIKSLLANKVTSCSTATVNNTTNTSATTNANPPAAVVTDTNACAALNAPQSCLITQNVNLQQLRFELTKKNTTNANSLGVQGGNDKHRGTVAQRQQKQKELAAQQQHIQSSPLKLSSTSISALVNNPLMQTTSLKVGQTTIKPITTNGGSEKRSTIISSENSDNSSWDPMPPMAPLSSGALVRSNVILQQQILPANDDSSSASIASSVVSSSQIEGEASFASFEDLLITKSGKNISTCIIEDDSSKDSLSRGSKDSGRQMLIANQMLVDLLDKKSPEPPVATKRKHDDDFDESDSKKMLYESEPKVTASKNAANFYAEMAASILEDEDLDDELSTTIVQTKVPLTSAPIQQQQQDIQKQVIAMPVNMPRQIIMNPNNPHQVILSQSTPQNNIPSKQTTLKTEQNLQNLPAMILQKNSIGAPMIQSVIQQQPPAQQQTQYVLATNPQGQTYLVAQQPQSQSQTQRLLVTQTPQQQAAGTKTIIILQQQGTPTQQGAPQQMLSTSPQPQKVIMTTPQGQQMIVTQMPRPVQHQIYVNTNGPNVIQSGPMQSHIQVTGPQQQIIQKQITAPNPNNNILSQLSHIPATIKIHQPSTPMVNPSTPQSTTTSSTTTTLPRLGKSVSIVQQQGIPPPPQTQVTPTVMQTQIVQHTGTPGSSEKRQVIISGGRAIEIGESTQQGQQMVRMVQQSQQQSSKPAVTIQKPIIRSTSTGLQTQATATISSLPPQTTASSLAPLTQSTQMGANIPTPTPQSGQPTTGNSLITNAILASNQSVNKVTTKPKVEMKPEVKVEAKPDIRIEPKIEKIEEEPIDLNWLYICDWRNCPRKKFKSTSDLHHHTCLVHCPEHLEAGAEIFCQWGPGSGLCDGIPRKRFSLMTHILDRHLTVESLKAAAQRRVANGVQPPTNVQPVTIIKNVAATTAQQQTSDNARGTASPALSTSSNGSLPSTGSAAMHAIKRHSSDFVNPKELMDENEGPVTKSIRLTAALILRNLVTYTPVAKRILRQYEPHLASVALSNVESSGTISQILFELNN